MSLPITKSVFLAPCLILLASPTFAQPPVQRPAEPQPRIRAIVEVVNVDVTVTDARGDFVRGLKRENFRVLDEGAVQPLSHFASLEAPAVVLVLVETSPAVYLLHRQHLDAAYALVAGLAADDQVALAGYDQSVRLLLPFSADKRAFAGALGGLRYNLGMADLRFYDAVGAALDWLAPLPGKKALVLLSTGLDTSGKPWKALAERIRSSEVTIYAVALGGELRDFKGGVQEETGSAAKLTFETADRVLKETAEVSGGRAFFPRKAGELEDIYRTIATTMRHRYSLGFAPPARDGQFHRIFVQLLDDRGRLLGPYYPELSPGPKPSEKGGVFPKRVRYRIHARRGYTAPGP